MITVSQPQVDGRVRKVTLDRVPPDRFGPAGIVLVVETYNITGQLVETHVDRYADDEFTEFVGALRKAEQEL